MKKQKITIITGPTASGKSKLALEMAQSTDGEIVNADAFQVYRGLRILTARPSPADEKNIPHHLFGYVDNNTQENMAGWLKKITDILPTLKNPIVVGGTGLYIQALTEGINEIPDISPEVRQKVRQMPFKEVQSLVCGQTQFQDEQRQRRALEVLLETGKPLTYFQRQPKKQLLEADFQIICVQPAREELYHRIEQRLVNMFQHGVVSEVQQLLQQGATGGVLKAIGVAEIGAYLQQKITLEQAQQQMLLATRHYAKRQMTWFRHQLPKDVIIK